MIRDSICFALLCFALPCSTLPHLARLTSPIPSRLFASDFRAISPSSVRSLPPVTTHRPSAPCHRFGHTVDYRDTPCASSSGFPAPPLPPPSSFVLGTPFPMVPLFAYPYKLPHVSENFHIGPNSHHHPGRNTHLRPGPSTRTHTFRSCTHARTLPQAHTLAHLHTYPYTSVPQ